jgi:uncharacterized membrane protein
LCADDEKVERLLQPEGMAAEAIARQDSREEREELSLKQYRTDKAIIGVSGLLLDRLAGSGRERRR